MRHRAKTELNNNNKEQKTMTKQLTLKELAQKQEIRTFKKIEEFKAINVNNEITERTCMTKEGKEFNIFEISLYNEDTDATDNVRVPKSVVFGLQVLLKDNPHLEYFKVVRTGQGMNTRYTVLPANNGVE